ncbi:MAG: hypothetical protein KF718_09975 [Polyangiaceae bacterium]|nr:hypothetical protein [Polyangiaceae bacterium]
MTRWVPRVAGAILLAASSACSASGGADGGGNASPCADVVCVGSLPTLQSGTVRLEPGRHPAARRHLRVRLSQDEAAHPRHADELALASGGRRAHLQQSAHFTCRWPITPPIM